MQSSARFTGKLIERSVEENMMINELQFSTAPGFLSKGGLLICGKNWCGSSENAEIEKASDPWAPYFSHPHNSSRYQTCLLKWFGLWDWKLEPKEPTFLDLAILQTNLFFTKSKRFRSGFDDKQWQYAFERLCTGIIRFNVSGLLITSPEVGDHFIEFSKASIIPQWDRAIGTPLSWSERGNDSLRLAIGKTTVLNIAIMSHPMSGVADSDIESECNKTAMHSWISEVVAEYKRKQFADQANRFNEQSSAYLS
jgi:hypothetical protein